MCESGVEVEPAEKFCEVSWFITVTQCSICNVRFVLFTDCVNNIIVSAVVFVMNNDQCSMQHHSGTACDPQGNLC